MDNKSIALDQFQPRKHLLDVVMHNDDVTTMEFVVFILQTFFDKTYPDAAKLMLQVHTEGKGTAGTYLFETARTKARTILMLAKSEGLPLECTIGEFGFDALPLEVTSLKHHLKNQWEHDTARSVRLAVDVGDDRKALELTTEWIMRCPDEEAPYIWAAKASANLSRHKAAAYFNTNALELNPDNRLGLINRSCAYTALSKPALAFKDASHAIELHPRDRDAHLAREAADWMLFENWSSGQNDKSLELEPACGAAYAWRAIEQCRQYQYQDAIEECNKSVSISSSVSPARLQRGWANLLMNNLSAADEDFRVLNAGLIERPNTRAMPYVQLLKAELLLGNHFFKDALAVYNRLVESRPDYIHALICRAHVLCSLKRLDEAMAELERISTLKLTSEEQAFVLSTQARVHLRRESFDNAVETIAAAVKMTPGVPAILATQGLILTRSGKLTEAEEPLSQAISIDPYFAEAYWFRHELYNKLGHADKSAADKQIAQKYGYKPYI